jgi:hypothetical protein
VIRACSRRVSGWEFDKSVKEFFLVQACPWGGREKDNRKTVVNRKGKDKKKDPFSKTESFSR